MVGSTCPFIGSWCPFVWERRTTCWVTMQVPDPNILVVRRSPPFHEGRDLNHHVPACSEGARACWGGGCRVCFWSRPISVGGRGRGSKRPAPCFLVPKGNQPTACTLALWWLKFGPTKGAGGEGGSRARGKGGGAENGDPPPCGLCNDNRCDHLVLIRFSLNQCWSCNLN